MGWLVLIAVAVVMVAFTVAFRPYRRRLDLDAHLSAEASVTLSVLPNRTAVVMLDVAAGAPSPALDRLIEHAVRDAFFFEAVEVVEVRRGNGELLNRRDRGGVLGA